MTTLIGQTTFSIEVVFFTANSSKELSALAGSTSVPLSSFYLFLIIISCLQNNILNCIYNLENNHVYTIKCVFTITQTKK